MTSNWLRTGKTGLLEIRLHVVPRAKKTSIEGLHGERLKIRLLAQPVDGEANETLLRFLSKRLGVAKSQLSILRGLQSREKDIQVEGLDLLVARELLWPDKMT